MTAYTQCDHITEETLAGQATKQISGICTRCGANLDIIRLENWCKFLEDRIKKLEKGTVYGTGHFGGV